LRSNLGIYTFAKLYLELMKADKRTIKELNIIEAAERVFSNLGFKNSKMEDIAKQAGITKVTLYSYFQSKENLYMAITFKALQELTDRCYKTIDSYRSKLGIDSSVALIRTFMEFCEENFLYSEALMEYFSLIRSTSNVENLSKIPESLQESIYFQKIQDIHNLPFKLSAKEMKRGQEDGSILKHIDPMLHTLHGWSVALGYIKVISASGNNTTPLFNTSLKGLKELNLKIARELLTGERVKLAPIS